VPRPGRVWEALLQNWSEIGSSLMPTLLEAATGFIIGDLTAALVAIGLIFFKPLSSVIMSASVVMRSVPIIALIPLMTLWLGFGIAPKAVTVILMVFFPTLVLVDQGLNSVEKPVLDLFQSYGATALTIAIKARMPMAVPYFFAALRMTAPSAILGAIIAEWLGGSTGIGHLMAMASYEYRVDLLWALILVGAGTGLASYATMVAAEWLFWPPSGMRGRGALHRLPYATWLSRMTF
jgi:NitT/TauT family transport system permease protein